MPFITRFILQNEVHPLVSNAVFTLSTITAYFTFIAIIYVTSAFFVRLTSGRSPVDCIIVLGCGLIEGRTVSPLLAGRVDCAIRLCRKGPERTMLVMSRGQGDDEEAPEGAAMKEYVVSKGVSQ